MNQQIPLRLTPVSGCSSDEDGNIRAGGEVVRFLLDAQVQSQAPSWRHARLDFQFSILHVSPQSKLRAAIFWQNVYIRNVELNNFNATYVSMPVYDFKVPSVLTIKIDLEQGGSEEFQSVGSAAPQITISSVRAEPAPDLLGARRHFAKAAAVLAADLGLRENHLDIERSGNLESRIVDALNMSSGFSAIRLGDLEGRVLGYPEHFSDQEALEQVLHYQFGADSMRLARDRYGDAWISKSMEILKQLLVESIKNTDVIGLPVVEYFDDNLPDKMGQIGYACALSYGVGLSTALGRDSYVGTNIFQSAAIKGRIFRAVVASAQQVFLVGPWDLREALGNSFSRNDFKYIAVPGHYSWRGYAGVGQYPNLFRSVENKIINRGDLSQCLFLVGAGLFGKHYCNLIKNRNGVALDIGSVFDSWARKGRPEAANDDRIDITQI